MSIPATRARPRYRLEFARGEGIVSAQRLRYRIFAEELGASLPDAGSGLDRDDYDEHCQHLLVRDLASGEVVACTRLLTDTAAHAAGGYYSQGEFDLGRVLERPGRFVEVGRTCVAQGYRNGAVIATLWQGIGEVVNARRVDYLFGCASIALRPDPAAAHAVLRHLLARHRSRETLSASPRRALPPAPPGPAASRPRIPPLLRTYVSLGAKACGEACWDPAFETADVLMLLDLRELDARFGRHFLGAPPMRGVAAPALA